MKKGFTSLEKATDFNQRLLLLKADSGFQREVAFSQTKKPASVQNAYPLKKLSNRIRKQSYLMAFTLSELLIAAAFLIFVLASLLILFINCIFLNEANRNLTTALMHAQYVMEEIKDTTFINIEPKISNGYWDWNTTEINSQGLTALKGEYIDSEVAGTDLLDIVVSVNWQDRRGRNRSTSLETLLAQP